MKINIKEYGNLISLYAIGTDGNKSFQVYDLENKDTPLYVESKAEAVQRFINFYEKFWSEDDKTNIETNYKKLEISDFKFVGDNYENEYDSLITVKQQFTGVINEVVVNGVLEVFPQDFEVEATIISPENIEWTDEEISRYINTSESLKEIITEVKEVLVVNLSQEMEVLWVDTPSKEYFFTDNAWNFVGAIKFISFADNDLYSENDIIADVELKTLPFSKDIVSFEIIKNIGPDIDETLLTKALEKTFTESFLFERIYEKAFNENLDGKIDVEYIIASKKELLEDSSISTYFEPSDIDNEVFSISFGSREIMAYAHKDDDYDPYITLQRWIKHADENSGEIDKPDAYFSDIKEALAYAINDIHNDKSGDWVEIEKDYLKNNLEITGVETYTETDSGNIEIDVKMNIGQESQHVTVVVDSISRNIKEINITEPLQMSIDDKIINEITKDIINKSFKDEGGDIRTVFEKTVLDLDILDQTRFDTHFELNQTVIVDGDLRELGVIEVIRGYLKSYNNLENLIGCGINNIENENDFIYSIKKDGEDQWCVEIKLTGFHSWDEKTEDISKKKEIVVLEQIKNVLNEIDLKSKTSYPEYIFDLEGWTSKISQIIDYRNPLDEKQNCITDTINDFLETENNKHKETEIDGNQEK